MISMSVCTCMFFLQKAYYNNCSFINTIKANDSVDFSMLCSNLGKTLNPIELNWTLSSWRFVERFVYLNQWEHSRSKKPTAVELKTLGKRTWSGESSKRSKIARPGSAYFSGDNSETNLLTPSSEEPSIPLSPGEEDEVVTSTGILKFRRAVVKVMMEQQAR